MLCLTAYFSSKTLLTATNPSQFPGKPAALGAIRGKFIRFADTQTDSLAGANLGYFPGRSLCSLTAPRPPRTLFEACAGVMGARPGVARVSRLVLPLPLILYIRCT